MSIRLFTKSYLILKSNATYCVLNQNRAFLNLFNRYSWQRCCGSTAYDIGYDKQSDEKIDKLYELIDKYENKIIYSCVIEAQKLKLGYKKNKAYEAKILRKQKAITEKLRQIEPLPVSLKYLSDLSIQTIKTDAVTEKEVTVDKVTQFPFEASDEIIKTHAQNEHIKKEEAMESVEDEILARHARYDEIKHKSWMTDYENFDDNEEEVPNSWQLNYGTPDPTSSVSNVPCGGCGALLHCKDTSIPGYIPSEIFLNHKIQSGQNLKSLICQRCHFLKYYNMALQVRVSREDYPQILMKIKENPKALVILMVDVLDFPSSLWPNIIDIIGNKRPVIIVGNKIDLLPQDSRGYLQRIKNILTDSISMTTSLKKANVKNVSLISAKTGYGVEELITTLHSIWKYKGDVYLLGCTNVGKSTLFNTLLQSDYCKSQAVDLIQRATTSPWPGTTLNLLKFPILKPSGWRLYARTKRLISLNKIRSQEARLRKIQLRKTNDPKYAMVIGHIERTFSTEEPVTETRDVFSVQGHSNASGKLKIGINEKDSTYIASKWCYDTPGVVNPAQILHLLTTEELVLALPKNLMQPRIFSLKPGTTIFLAGLGRLDFIEGPTSMRFCVFASEHLPITICETTDADALYVELLGTDLFKVPSGGKERLDRWPALETSEEIQLKGTGWEKSCADIVLSNAGWISVTCGEDINFVLKAWTPENKGIFVRDCILPHAVSLRGRRIRFSPAYRKPRFFVQ